MPEFLIDHEAGHRGAKHDESHGTNQVVAKALTLLPRKQAPAMKTSHKADKSKAFINLLDLAVIWVYIGNSICFVVIGKSERMHQLRLKNHHITDICRREFLLDRCHSLADG